MGEVNERGSLAREGRGQLIGRKSAGWCGPLLFPGVLAASFVGGAPAARTAVGVVGLVDSGAVVAKKKLLNNADIL